MDDAKLINLFWNRDEDAIEQTAWAYGTSLQRLANRITGDESDAQECVNDTYLAAWNSIPPTRPQSLFAYLSRICRNFAFGILDKRNAEKRSAVMVELSQELQQCIPDRMADARIESSEIGELLNRFMRGLKQEERRIFLRRYWFGDSVADIANHLRVTQSKVKTQLHRTRIKLRSFLDQEGFHI